MHLVFLALQVPCLLCAFLSLQKYIFYNCKDLVELCAAKIKDNWIVLLDLLAMVLNSGVKYVLIDWRSLSLSLSLSQMLCWCLFGGFNGSDTFQPDFNLAQMTLDALVCLFHMSSVGETD